MRSFGKATAVLLMSLTVAACGGNKTENNLKSSGLSNLWDNFSGSNSSQKELLANNTVYFGFDRYNISEDAKDALKMHADYLVAHPEAKVRIEGHTDQKGNANYNVGLGERRAKSVSDYLVLAGVSPDQLEVVSYGAQKLAVNDVTDEAYQMNRRTEIFYDQE